jgi:undecaprenyl pyrophosphate phosphatase UppP
VGVSDFSAQFLGVKLKRSLQFKIHLALLVACIIGFQFYRGTIDNFFTNPFYIGSMLVGVLLVLKAIFYSCQKCRRNQVILGWYRYRLPKERCYNCGHNIDNSRS